MKKEQVIDTILMAHYIKPQNIKIETHGSLKIPKILDFGFATLKQSFSDYRGTRGYIPPELVFGEEATSKSDVFSYGVILFQIAIRLPVLNLSYYDIKRRNRLYPKLDVFEEQLEEQGFSDEFISLILDCIEIDPSKRIDMKTVVQRLEEKDPHTGKYKYIMKNVDPQKYSEYILYIKRKENEESIHYSLSHSLSFSNICLSSTSSAKASTTGDHCLKSIHEDIVLNIHIFSYFCRKRKRF